MSNENTRVLEALLLLKSKAANGIAWTADERKKIQRWLQEDSYIRVLAACCVLASERLREFPGSLDIVRDAITRRHLPAYLELSIYEALVFVEARQLEPYFNDIFELAEGTLAARVIDLENTICVLGKLARAGEHRALAVLRSLADDGDTRVRKNAVELLHKLAADQ